MPAATCILSLGTDPAYLPGTIPSEYLVQETASGSKMIFVDAPRKPPRAVVMSDLQARVSCIVIASSMTFDLGHTPRTY